MAGAFLYKATWFLKYGRGGFSFSHYMEENGHAQVLTKAELLAEKYLECCGNAVSLGYIRVSQEGILGDSQVLAAELGTNDPNNVAAKGFKKIIMPADPDAADKWWTSALLRLGATPSIFGHQFMRGIPDNVTVTPGRRFNDPDFVTAVQRYLNVLVGQTWGMFAINKSLTSNNKIMGAGVNVPANSVRFLTNGPHNINQGEEIRISRFGPQKAKVSPNGVWTVSDVPFPDTIDIKQSQGITLPAKWKRNGYLWSLKKVFVVYNRSLCDLVRVTRRKAGRPFDQPAGKAKTRK